MIRLVPERYPCERSACAVQYNASSKSGVCGCCGLEGGWAATAYRLRVCIGRTSRLALTAINCQNVGTKGSALDLWCCKVPHRRAAVKAAVGDWEGRGMASPTEPGGPGVKCMASGYRMARPCHTVTVWASCSGRSWAHTCMPCLGRPRNRPTRSLSGGAALPCRTAPSRVPYRSFFLHKRPRAMSSLPPAVPRPPGSSAPRVVPCSVRRSRVHMPYSVLPRV